jgi:hypothetical protein
MDQPERNPNDLRVIKTGRSPQAINAAVDAGYEPLIKPVERNPEVSESVAVLQNVKTGKIRLCGDCRDLPRDDERVVLPFTDYYPYFFNYPFAAYLLPRDLYPGTRVWLDDLIEEIVAVWGNQGYFPRLKWAEATWNGKDFDIHFYPDKDAPRWLG